MPTAGSKEPQPLPIDRPIVLVGLMGAGKSSIGRLLGRALELEFTDADTEIETAASATIEEIFEQHGEETFRSGERRVIARLLDGPVRVIATGGGAFMDEDTREAIKKAAISVWLKADLETLVKRVSRRGGRPLLKGEDAREVLIGLIAARDPVYATADVTVETSDDPPAEITRRVIKALAHFLGFPDYSPPDIARLEANNKGQRNNRASNGKNRGSRMGPNNRRGQKRTKAKSGRGVAEKS